MQATLFRFLGWEDPLEKEMATHSSILVREIPWTITLTLTSSNNIREDSTHGHHQMVNTEIRLIIFFAAKDREALYSQQKQDQELTVAQIMNSLLPNSDLN